MDLPSESDCHHQVFPKRNSETISGISLIVMVSFMCLLDKAVGCADIRLNIISDCVYVGDSR